MAGPVLDVSVLAVSVPAHIAASWIVTFGAVAAYAAWVLRRGRQLSRRLPPGRRRWMDAPGPGDGE